MIKLAFLCESASNEPAAHILAEAALASPIIRISHSLEVYGWHLLHQVLKPAIKKLHYNSDAEGLVILFDSNDSPVHQLSHDENDPSNRKCRVCQVRLLINQTQLRPRGGRPDIKLAVGVAVPSIEAWFRCGIDAHVTESAWVQAQQSGSFRFSRESLKLDVYGTTRPSKGLEIARSTDAANRLADNLDLLKNCFPIGFGSLAEDLAKIKRELGR